MARITIISIGTRGDVQPYIALGIGLQAAGNRIRLVTHANFREMVTSYGLDYEPLNSDAQAMISAESGLYTLEAGTNPLLLMNRLADAAAPAVHQMTQDILSGLHDTDLALGSALGFSAGYPPAHRLGIPIYPAYVQPGTPTTVYPNPFFPTIPGGVPLSPAYNRLTHWLFRLVLIQVGRRMTAKGKNNKSPDSMDSDQLYGSSSTSGQPFFYGFSPQLVPKPYDWGESLHITGYWFLDQQHNWQPTAELLNFLAAGPPPVYVGFGSMSSRNPAALAEIAIEALQTTGQRGILSTGWGGLDPKTLPENVLVIDSAPHDWLFPRMSAIVHHGGSGTTGEALRAGLPQIVIPFSFDQPFWASRARAIGVGQSIARRKLTAERLAAAITRAINDQRMRARAATVGAAVQAENGVGQAVRLINDLLLTL
jgi:sterol 3beta-glucosyltransferase